MKGSDRDFGATHRDLVQGSGHEYPRCHPFHSLVQTPIFPSPLRALVSHTLMINIIIIIEHLSLFCFCLNHRLSVLSLLVRVALKLCFHAFPLSDRGVSPPLMTAMVFE